MMKKGEGYAGAMISAFIILFTLIILWNVFTPAVNSVLNSVEPLMDNDSDSLNIFDKLRSSWQYYPIILVIALIVFMVVRGITREPYQY